MKKITTIMILASITALSACASDDAMVKEDEASTEMATEQAPAAMPESETMESETMESESVSEDSVTEPAEAATDVETTDSGADSDNLVSTCTYGGDTRIISVIYDNEATDTVCEVTYEKTSGVQTLWSANNERDYCKEKAEAFVEKQRGWGWTCSDLE